MDILNMEFAVSDLNSCNTHNSYFRACLCVFITVQLVTILRTIFFSRKSFVRTNVMTLQVRMLLQTLCTGPIESGWKPFYRNAIISIIIADKLEIREMRRFTLQSAKGFPCSVPKDEHKSFRIFSRRSASAWRSLWRRYASIARNRKNGW
jgi:hypothetical protein